MKLGNYSPQSFLAPKPLPARRTRTLPAIHIAVFSPSRSYGTCRISTRLDWQTENGMRQSVFSFAFTEPALLLDGAHDFLGQFVRASFQQPLRCGGFAINHQARDAHQSPR